MSNKRQETSADISTFTMTFVVEVQGLEEWHDCEEGTLELGPPVRAVKFGYSLYPGQSYDIEVTIWPHVAKISSRTATGWVRTWLHVNKRWLAFSIIQALRINVEDLRDHKVVVTIIPGAPTGNQQVKHELFIPKLARGEPRQFADVVHDKETHTFNYYIKNLIWDLVENHIPRSFLDVKFDTPQRVTDIRHQDAVLGEVNAASLHKEPSIPQIASSPIPKDKSKVIKGKDTKGKLESFEIRFTGDMILAAGRSVIKGEPVGAKPSDQGDVMVLLSSCNLPPPTGNPVFFVNVLKLHDMPVEATKSAGFSQVYTRWKLPQEDHSSEVYPVTRSIILKDPRALPLEPKQAARLLASFQEQLLEIEIRGIRDVVPIVNQTSFFGYSPRDKHFNDATKIPHSKHRDNDVLLAVCRLDLKSLFRGNGIINGCFPVFPPPSPVYKSSRKPRCTNEINLIRTSRSPEQEISTAVILEAMPTLTLSVGYIGCRPAPISISFSRLLCAPRDTDATAAILEEIHKANQRAVADCSPEDLLTGWAADLGTSAIIFVEGPSLGHVISVWNNALNFEDSNASFSSAARYPTRVYSEMLERTVPFLILKFHAPLNAFLACPSVYARPTLPLPAKSALLKLGRMIMCGVDSFGPGDILPTAVELESICLELAVPLRPSPVRRIHGIFRNK